MQVHSTGWNCLPTSISSKGVRLPHWGAETMRLMFIEAPSEIDTGGIQHKALHRIYPTQYEIVLNSMGRIKHVHPLLYDLPRLKERTLKITQVIFLPMMVSYTSRRILTRHLTNIDQITFISVSM